MLLVDMKTITQYILHILHHFPSISKRKVPYFIRFGHTCWEKISLVCRFDINLWPSNGIGWTTYCPRTDYIPQNFSQLTHINLRIGFYFLWARRNQDFDQKAPILSKSRRAFRPSKRTFSSETTNLWPCFKTAYSYQSKIQSFIVSSEISSVLKTTG